MTATFSDKSLLIEALGKPTGLAYETLSEMVVRPKSIELGDWSLPCFSFAKEWKLAPADCAKKISQEMDLPEIFERVETVGPYLNFFLNRKVFGRNLVEKIIEQKFSVGKGSNSQRTVVVEYSSPNIAKTFHVGHLRTTLIGLCLDRVLRHRGYKVIAINHLGDWGTQFGFVYAGCELWGKPKTADVDSLVDIYIKATTLKKQQDEGSVSPEDRKKPNVNEMARNYFIRLEAGDPEALTFWRWCLDLSLDYLKSMYSRLGIHFDHYTGESFYRDMVPGVEELIQKSNILEESRGALGVDLGEDLGFVRIFAEDGRSLYITRDIAAAIYRHDTFSPEKILYVVAAQQSLHFRQLIGLFEKLAHPVASEIVHVPFGFVPGMKTRDGGAISLKDFLTEAHDRARTAYQSEVQKRPEGLDEESVSESVAIGATYFYFLNHSNTKDFNFNWDEALNFQGDSGPYIQYALARLNSIAINAEKEGLRSSPKALAEVCEDNDAYELVAVLARFDQVLESVCKEYEPNTLANYVLDLAKAFSKAYRKLRVIGEEKDIAQARLALFEATKYVLHNGCYLLGVPPIERM